MRWRTVLILAAVAAWLAPSSSTFIERWFSNGVFLSVQRVLTHFSNRVPFAFFDALLLLLLVGVVAGTWADVRRPGSTWPQTVGRGVMRLTTLVAVAYLAFLATWGLNYRRLPLPERRAFDASRVSSENAGRLATLTVTRVNALYVAAHAETPSPVDEVDVRLARAFMTAQPAFAASTPLVPGRPKRSLLDFYFRRAGVAGMTDPYFLETLIATDLLPVERPMVVAHEWGHLAGLGDEGEANFAGFVACLQGSALQQYSGWLSLYGDVIGGLPRPEADRVAQALDPGPRADLQAIRERLLRQISPTIASAGWRVYDRYLKANQVNQGTNSYADVVRLVLGTQAAEP